MKKYFLATLLATLFAPAAFAQHAEIEFGFEDVANPVFELELDEVTDEGIQVAVGEFIPFGAFATTDSPGFITPVSSTENLTVAVGDQVFVRVLDASAADSPTTRGVGFVNFYSPDTPGLQNLDSSSGTFTITGNTIGSSSGSLSVFAGDQLLSGEEELFLAVGSDGTNMSNPPPSTGEELELLGGGQIHNHLGFDLSGDLASTPGAIGVLLQFSVTRPSTGEVIDSDPFFLIFNNGLTDEEFADGALPAFGLGGHLPGDVNEDGVVDFGDIPAFIALLQTGGYSESADTNGDGVLDFADISGFIAILINA